MSIRSRRSKRSQSVVVGNLAEMKSDFVLAFQEQVSEALVRFAHALFDGEVETFAGKSHRRGRGTSGFYRAGSDPGSIVAGGQRLAVRKPRLKQGGQEVPLKSYRSLKNMDLLEPRIVEHMIAGVSTRDYDTLVDELAGGLGLSKSSVSRAWIRGSQKILDELRTRDLSKPTWCALMIDGIHFADRSVVVAIGIDGTGEKMILGLVEGNTESSAICSDLLHGLIARGLRTDLPFLFVIDGGKGLRKAIRDVFGEKFPVQRCMIHKARNIEAYLPDRTYGEFRMRWKKMNSMETYADAAAELAKLCDWLSRVNHDAKASLDEAVDELLTAHRLGVCRILRRALTNTNAIETWFGRVRAITMRVRNWSSSSDQIQRWVAVALRATETQSARIKGYDRCDALLATIHKNYLPMSGAVA